MTMLHHRLRFGDCLDLAWQPHDRLHLLHAGGRGIQVDVPAGWCSLWWPVQGRLALAAAGCEWDLPARRMQLWRDGALRCRALGPQAWLALAGPAAIWDAHIQASEAKAGVLLPWHGRPRREAAGLLARLARSAQPAPTRSAGDAAALFGALRTALADQQAELRSLLPRCNGRTYARRQQTLLRLLRVRHMIECHPDMRMDLERLAALANYSPCHLIRVYRGVFGETPYEYAARLRERQAWEMVSGTGLPICEITEMLGFESQSAFCRAFKNTFGQTTSEVRRSLQHAGQAVAA